MGETEVRVNACEERGEYNSLQANSLVKQVKKWSMEETLEIIWSKPLIFQKPRNLGNSAPRHIKECFRKHMRGYQEKQTFSLIDEDRSPQNPQVELELFTVLILFGLHQCFKCVHLLPRVSGLPSPRLNQLACRSGESPASLPPVFLRPFSAHQHLQQKAEEMKLRFVNVNC